MARKETLLAKAAKAAHTTQEEFARQVRGLLRTTRCRDTATRKRVFTAEVMTAISHA